MMKEKATEYRTDWRTGNRTVYKNFEISGNTMEELYKNMYSNERSARYCSDVSYRFDNPEIDLLYRNWKERGVTFQMFYGNATVD